MLGFLGRLFGGRALFPRRDAPRERPAERAERAEPADFAGWVRHFGLDEAGLRTLYRRHAARCYLLLGGALFAASFGASAALAASGPALAGLALSIAALFLAGAAGHSLRAWQVRERRLGAFGEWAKTPGAWLPPPFRH